MSTTESTGIGDPFHRIGDAFRETKGKEFLETMNLEFKKNLLNGFDNIEEVVNANYNTTISTPPDY